MQDKSVAFIGLGAMGSSMVRALLGAGFAVAAYNRTRERADALIDAGAHVANTPAAAVSAGGVVITMVANDAALEAVTFGEDGFLDKLGPGGLHISMSTVSPEISRKLAEAHADEGSLFVSAPVFGRPEAAAAKKLWICQSGAPVARERARPYLEALGQAVFDFGDDPGAANVTKLAGNFLIFAATEAMAEAFALAEKSGVDRKTLSAFFGQSMFACPIYQNYGRLLAERAYDPPGFKLELGMKDVRLVREVAEDAALPMPLADLVHARLLSALAKGRGGLDLSAMELGVAEDGNLDV